MLAINCLLQQACLLQEHHHQHDHKRDLDSIDPMVSIGLLERKTSSAPAAGLSVYGSTSDYNTMGSSRVQWVSGWIRITSGIIMPCTCIAFTMMDKMMKIWMETGDAQMGCVHPRRVDADW